MDQVARLLRSAERTRREGRAEAAYMLLREAYVMAKECEDHRNAAWAAVGLAHNVQSFVPEGVSNIFDYRQRLCMEAIERFQKDGVERGTASAYRLLSTCVTNMEGKALLEESLTICRRIADWSGVVLSLGALGSRLCVEDRMDEGMRHHRKAIRLARLVNDEEAIANACLSAALCSEDDNEHRQMLFEEAQNIFRRRRLWEGLFRSLQLCAWFACDEGDLERRAAYLEEALHICRQMGNTDREADCLEDLAKIASCRGKPTQVDLARSDQTCLSKAERDTQSPTTVWQEGDADTKVDLVRKIIVEKTGKGGDGGRF